MNAGLAWGLLVLAGLLDVAWATAVKQSDGYTRHSWTLVSLLLLASFVYLLGKAVKVLPIGTAYAVWTGIGAAGVTLVGIWFFGESASPTRIGGIGLVVVSIILLKLAPS